MSVVISMNMPKDCDSCPFFDDNGDYPTCTVTQHSKGYRFSPFNQRMDDCPLTEVRETMKFSRCWVVKDNG